MAVGVIAPLFRLSPVRTAVVFDLVVGSHAILDTLTDGGFGCALWWPFDNHRYFAPWNPIPVAPIGLRYFSKDGLSVALAELVLFSPVFIYAVWPRQKRRSEANRPERYVTNPRQRMSRGCIRLLRETGPPLALSRASRRRKAGLLRRSRGPGYRPVS